MDLELPILGHPGSSTWILEHPARIEKEERGHYKHPDQEIKSVLILKSTG